MKIETVPLNSIIPYARNPRRNAGAVATVKASLQEYGWQQPIVVDKDRVIIVGHTRYLAALERWATHTGKTPAMLAKS
jgi:ParB-like chromosome segregation protein Spo0J